MSVEKKKEIHFFSLLRRIHRPYGETKKEWQKTTSLAPKFALKRSSARRENAWNAVWRKKSRRKEEKVVQTETTSARRPRGRTSGGKTTFFSRDEEKYERSTDGNAKEIRKKVGRKKKTRKGGRKLKDNGCCIGRKVLTHAPARKGKSSSKKETGKRNDSAKRWQGKCLKRIIHAVDATTKNFFLFLKNCYGRR